MGVAFSLPENDIHSFSKGWLIDRITINLGGYAAETIIYKETSSGSQNDIEQSTEYARRMVCEWGMSETIGPVALGKKEEPIFIGKEIARHKDYSEQTAQKIDDEIKRIVESCFNNAIKILSDNRRNLDLLAETLFSKETLDDDEVRKLIGFPPRKSEDLEASQSNPS